MKRSVHWSGWALQHSLNAAGSVTSATILPVSTYSTFTSPVRLPWPWALATTGTPMRAATSVLTLMLSVIFTPPPSMKRWVTYCVHASGMAEPSSRSEALRGTKRPR